MAVGTGAGKWRTSSRCDSANCVEVLVEVDRVVVRGRASLAGPMLAFEPHTWMTFIAALKSDEPFSTRCAM